MPLPPPSFSLHLLLGAVCSFLGNPLCAASGCPFQCAPAAVTPSLAHLISRYGLDWIPPYNPVVETVVSLVLAAVWMGTNAWYWNKVWKRVQFNLNVIDEVDIGWMIYKFKGRKGMKGKYDSEKLIAFKEDPKTAARRKAKAAAAAAAEAKKKEKAAKGKPATSEPPAPPKKFDVGDIVVAKVCTALVYNIELQHGVSRSYFCLFLRPCRWSK